MEKQHLNLKYKVYPPSQNKEFTFKLTLISQILKVYLQVTALMYDIIFYFEINQTNKKKVINLECQAWKLGRNSQ